MPLELTQQFKHEDPDKWEIPTTRGILVKEFDCATDDSKDYPNAKSTIEFVGIDATYQIMHVNETVEQIQCLCPPAKFNPITGLILTGVTRWQLN